MAELDWIVRVLGAVQDEKHALGILRPARGVTAERAMDRDIGNDRRAGRPELDAYRTPEAIAARDEALGIDQRLLGKSIEAGLSARRHERAILGEHIGVLSNLREIFRQHAEHVG